MAIEQNIILILISFVLIMLIVFFSVGVYTWLYSFKLYLYLRRRKPKKWKNLTTFSGIESGMSNPFKWVPYIFDESDIKDRNILNYKKKLKFTIIVFSALFTILASMIIAIVLLMGAL